MGKIALHDVFLEILEAPFPDGGSHCYFSPPANKKIDYPCIVYNHTNNEDEFADNIPYRRFKRYTVTVIDEDPDSKIPERLTDRLPYCSSDRNFAVDGLNHFVYSLFYDGPRIKEENNG